jgi:DNA-directed RNA polymerase III subunit RPC3
MRQLAAAEIDDERKEYRNPAKALKEIKGKKKERNTSEDDMWDVVEDVPLRVNYDKYNVLIRNEMLIKAATDRWNAAAGGDPHGEGRGRQQHRPEHSHV